MNQIYNQKKFLKNLTEDEFKTLLLLGLAKLDKLQHTHYQAYVKSLDDLLIEVPDPREWGNMDLVKVETSIESLNGRTPVFFLDDFHMSAVDDEILCLEPTLHGYLTNKYVQNYTEALYNQRVKEAQRERATLLEARKTVDEDILKLKLK